MYIYCGSVGADPTKKNAKLSSSISGSGEGIYTLEWDGKKLSYKSVCYADNAGIITISHNAKYVYCANETKDFTGLNGSGGGVSAFEIKSNGDLSKINDSVSYGSRTSYVSINNSDDYLIASNHGSHTTVTCSYKKNKSGEWVLNRGFDDSSIAVFKLNQDGSIKELSDLMTFKGKGYWCYGGGQSTSHLHSVKINNDIIIAGNRGADKLEVLKLDEKSGKLKLLNRYSTKPGFAPRHIDYHPNMNVFYVVNENYAVASAYKYDNETGKVDLIGHYKTMNENYYIDNPIPNFRKKHASQNEINTSGLADYTKVMPSDVHVSPNSKFLYVSNRCFKGIASITTYSINEDGSLKIVGIKELEGGDPRGFALLDSSNIIIGLCDKNKVQIYSIDETLGCLKEKKAEIDIKSPSSFTFARL